MNELRMYVEQLFQNRVLTSDTIELKEEIYGNLIARYEDYIAQGLSHEEALQRTKESMTSIDDVMSGEEAMKNENLNANQNLNANVTEQMPIAASQAGAAPPAGDPAPKRRKPWMIAAAAAAAILVLVCGVAIGMNIMPKQTQGQVPQMTATVDDTTVDDTVQDVQKTEDDVAPVEQEPVEEQKAEPTKSTEDQAAETKTSTTQKATTSSATTLRSMPRLTDDDGPRERQATEALADEVLNSPLSTLTKYASTKPSSADNRAAFVRALPLGDYVTASSFSNGTLAIDYSSVNHNIDGDAIDLALAYDVVAIMATYGDSVDSVKIELHESDDHSYDVDTYIFDRAMVEDMLASVSSNEYTKITGSMLESKNAWNKVFNNVATYRFFDNVTDYAELDY